MQRVNELLKASRLKKNISLEKAEKDTKIRQTILQHLEEGEYDLLPSSTFVKGLIKNYGNYLGLSSDFLLALYRREFAPPKSFKSSQTTPFPLGKTAFILTPRQKISLSALFFTLVFGAYLAFQYFSYWRPPTLMVDTPLDQSRITTATVEVVGRTDPDAQIVINNQAIQLQRDGIFTQVVVLQPGINTITIVATSKSSQKTQITRTVVVETLVTPTPFP